MENSQGRLDRRNLLIGAGALAAANALPGAASAAGEVSKSFIFLIRKPGMSREDFMHHWLEVHGGLAKKVPGMKSLIFHEVPPPAPAASGSHLPTPTDVIPIDGIAEAVREDVASPEMAAFQADVGNFVGQIKVFVVKEKVWLPPRRGGQCLLGLLKRKPDWTHEAFVKHWNDVHGSMAVKVPEVGGFVTNEIVASPPGTIEGLGEPDGIAQSWHKNPGTPVASPEGKAWYADGAYLVGEARAFRTIEHVII